MSRARMTMRAEIERDQATGADAYGGPPVPDFQPLITLPCWLWSRARREIVDGKKTAVLEDLRAMFPLTADLRTGDRLARVHDRAGVSLLAGPLRIDAVQRKHRHLEASLERIT